MSQQKILHNNDHGVANATVTFKTEVMEFDHVVLVGDRECSLATLGSRPLGIATRVPDTFPGSGSVQTEFPNYVYVKCGETIAAGDPVKLGTTDPTTKEQKYIKFNPATDNGIYELGVCFVGGDVDEYGEFYVR